MKIVSCAHKKSIKMKSLIKIVLVLGLFIGFYSCQPDDSTTIVPARPYDEVYEEDILKIEEFLDTHYVTVDADFNTVFTKIPDGGAQVPVSDMPELEFKEVDLHDITYKVYYLKLREGTGESPTRVDSTLVGYKGNTFYKTTLNGVDSYTQTVFEENAEKKVFISYNHADAAVANKIKDTLRAEEIEVTIDSEKMAAGEDIKAFIEKCVRETDITLSVVSKKSLLSAWVAMESMNTFYLEKGTNSKKFIPCYIDPEFFNHSFTDNAIDETDAKLELLDSLFAKRIEQKQGIDDIDDERARLLDLKHNMDKIIGRLRNSLCVDIREENFEPGMKKIIQTIKES